MFYHCATGEQPNLILLEDRRNARLDKNQGTFKIVIKVFVCQTFISLTIEKKIFLYLSYLSLITICGRFKKNITIVNDTSRVIRMMIVSDAPCGVVASLKIVILTTLEVSFVLLEL